MFLANYVPKCQMSSGPYGPIFLQRDSVSSHSTALSGSPQLTQMHMEQVHDMMADAMQESQTSRDESDSDGKKTSVQM